jgi:hypothetical protein
MNVNNELADYYLVVDLREKFIMSAQIFIGQIWVLRPVWQFLLGLMML